MIIKNTRILQSMMKRTRFGSWLHSCLSQLRFFLLKMGKKKKKKIYIYIYIYGYSKGCPESGGCREAVCPQALCRAPWGHCHMSHLHHAHSYVLEPGYCPVRLGMTTGRLQSGVNTLQGFKEDKRNKVTPGKAPMW